MTIYYVDPYTGSNAAAGTSWGTAWRWLPGNGTAILPGDEIRFAKSASYLVTASNTTMDSAAFATGNTTIWKARAVYSSVSGGISGVTAASGGANFAANTVVPADSKICYMLVSGTGYSPINSAIMTLFMQGVPTGGVGQYLKVVLCSDALGDTPIVTLTGKTVFSDSEISGWTSGYRVGVQFTYESPTPLAITIGSVAIYSVAGFTVPASGGGVAQGGIIFGPVTSALTYYAVGQTLELVGPPIPGGLMPVDLGTTQTREVYQVAHVERQTDNIAYHVHMPAGRRPYNSVLSLRAYVGLPDASSVYTESTPLTFSGTAGARILIRGGFNTATNVQDGYTNIGGIQGVGPLPRNGAFVFSAGGQYLEFERFDCLACNLVYYSYSTASFTIPLVKVTDCNVGSGSFYQSRLNSLASENSIVGVNEATTQLTIESVLLARSSVWGICSARRGGSYKKVVGGDMNVYFTSGQLTYVDVSLVDCVVSAVGAALNALPFNVTGSFAMTSSTQHYRSSILRGVDTLDDLVFPSSLTFPLVFSDVLIGCDSEVSNFSVANYNTVPNNVSLQLTRVGIGAATTPTFHDIFELYGFANVTIDGLILCSPSSVYSSIFRINNSAAWRTLNPSATLTLGGPWGAYGSSKVSYMELIYPPALVTGPGMTAVSAIVSYYAFVNPCLQIYYPADQATLSNLRFAQIEVLTQPTSGYDNAYVDIENCETRPWAAASVQTGYVRMIGGTLGVASQVTSMQKTSISGIAPAISYYDVLTSAALHVGQNVTMNDYPTPTRRAIGTGLRSATAMTPASGRTTYQARVPMDLHLAPTTAIADATAGCDLTVSMHRGDGVGFHMNGVSTMYLPGTIGPYGMLDMFVLGSVPLGELDVEAGTTVTLTLAVVVTAATLLIMELIPCDAFTSDLLNHVMRKNIRTYNETLTYTFSFAPQKSGNVSVKLFTSTRVTVQRFAVAAS